MWTSSPHRARHSRGELPCSLRCLTSCPRLVGFDVTRDHSVSSNFLYSAVSGQTVGELDHEGSTGVRKGEQTRREIIRKAAPIFNQKGYDGAALSDLMRATGLEKGGIYRHFASKQELAGDASTTPGKLQWTRASKEQRRSRIPLIVSNKSCGTFAIDVQDWCREAARC